MRKIEKNFYNIYFFIFVICYLYQINQGNCYHFQNVHFLISAKLNGTSPVISLNKLEPDSNFVNFIFDFSYHSNNIPESRNTAYFNIRTNLDFNIDEENNDNENSIVYRFFKEDWTKIAKKSIAKNLIYKNIKILSKEKDNYDNKIYIYYFKIDRQKENDNTLMIKVPNQNKKEGFIGIENILN